MTQSLGLRGHQILLHSSAFAFTGCPAACATSRTRKHMELPFHPAAEQEMLESLITMSTQPRAAVEEHDRNCQPARLLLTGSSARLLMWSPTLPKTVHSWKIKNVDLRYKYWKWDWLAWKSSLRKITCSHYPDISYAKTILALDYLLPVPFALQYFLMQVHGAFSFCRHY